MRGAAAASLVWGYRPVARVLKWTITRHRDSEKEPWRWMLQGRIDGPVDAFALRQRPLLLSVPRRGGFFCWVVRELTVGAESGGLTASLGPPEA